jgi:hypothetical protein
VLKALVLPKPRATDVDAPVRMGRVERAEYDALKKLEGRTVRVAMRRRVVDDIGTRRRRKTRSGGISEK